LATKIRMNYPKYTELDISVEFDVFEFISKGVGGKILKKIQFTKTQYHSIYNLGFGDKRDDGTIDDAVDSKNGDRDKILATVAGVVYEYTSVYPERSIIFSGSTDARTRLYRMAISKNYDELNRDFHIFAIVEENGEIIKMPFENNIVCLGFIVLRKEIVNI
jgi:hypothetical protein